MEPYEIVVFTIIAVVALVIFARIYPYFRQGRSAINPYSIERGNPLIRDEIEGFEGEVFGGRLVDEVTFLLYINVAHKLVPLMRHVQYKEWELEPLSIFQQLVDKKPPIWIRRRRNGNGFRKDIPEAAVRAEAHRITEDATIGYKKLVDGTTKLLATAKNRPAPTDSE